MTTPAFQLAFSEERLQLLALHRPGYGPIYADWTTADQQRRIRAGRRQPLARALGLHRLPEAHILDATGGLGRDAFTLAALGAQVSLAERNESVFELLRDAHRLALLDPQMRPIAQRIKIENVDARTLAARGCLWDTAYLDPMYPGDGKTALPSKEMQILRELTGGDLDADELLWTVQRCVRLRVAVKRPLKAPPLGGVAAASSIRGTQLRFDLYPAAPALAAAGD